jgi:hypothetical protein
VSDPNEGREPENEERAPERPADRRYGISFVTVIARAWRYYRDGFGPLLRLSLVATSLLYGANLVLLTDLSEGTQDTLVYVLQGLLPPFAYSLAFAVVASIHHHEDLDDPVLANTAFREVRSNLRPLISIALVASAASVLMAQLSGLLLFALLYGPPILIQVAAVESLGLQPAWQRTKTLMSRAWGRTILHLITVMLGLSILANASIGTALAIASGLDDSTRTGVYLVTLGLFLTLGMPFLASAQFVLYAERRAELGTGGAG